ncbi:MAG TPA: hypothetical protein VIN08_12475 [Ohtaekwangia sp.]|uniref:hypothetical protein n=1 Tax=Ohtaekwangia sp. TaxID=2066019 RepID=UPI002F93A8F3
MSFINPIELLGLQEHDVSAISADVVKKARRKLLAEIELSENSQFEFKGQSLTRSDCERAIDELENTDKKEFYHYLTKNIALNDFLTAGDERIFESFGIDSIYSLPAFITFISPYVVPRFDRSLYQAFANGRAEHMRAILRTQVLIETSNVQAAYKLLTVELESRTQAVREIANAIKENRYSDDPAALMAYIAQQFPADTINALPVYFQGLVQKAADTINVLAVHIWNAYRLPAISKELTDHVLTFEADNVHLPKYKANLVLYTNKSEALAHAPELHEWYARQTEIEVLYKGLKNKTIAPHQVAAKVNDLIDIDAINALPLFANEVRERTAFLIREVAVNSWNLGGDINAALVLIDKAFRVNNSNDFRFDILGQKKALEKIKEDTRAQNLCWFCQEREGEATKGRDVTLYKEISRGGGEVKYQHITLRIPRCYSCEEIHSNRMLQLLMVRISAGLLALLVLVLFRKNIVVTLLLMAAVYSGIEYFFYRRFKEYGIRSISSSSVGEHPEVNKYIRQGWGFYKPT